MTHSVPTRRSSELCKKNIISSRLKWTFGKRVCCSLVFPPLARKTTIGSNRVTHGTGLARSLEIRTRNHRRLVDHVARFLVVHSILHDSGSGRRLPSNNADILP